MYLWKRKCSIVFLLAMLALMVLVPTVQAAPSEQIISVQGAARRQVEPDLAYVTVGVQTEAASVEEARNANQEVMSRIADALKAEEIASNKIQTSRLQITPAYSDAKNGKRTLTGYVMQNTVIVELSDMDKLGTIIDAMLNAGANQLQGVRFTVKDEAALQDELLREAVKDGRHRAEIVADAGGRSLGALVSASVAGGNDISSMETAQYRVMGKMANTAVYSGAMQVSVDVQMSFALQ